MKHENWNGREADRFEELSNCEADRFEVKLATQLHPDEPGAKTVDIVIRDLSATGFMAECTSFVRIGSIVSVDLQRVGRVSATVIWALAGRLGGKFNGEVDVAALAEENPA